MVRNFIGFIAGVLLSYLLIFAGWRVAWLLLAGNADRTNNPGTMISLGITLIAVIAPSVSFVVGAVVASIALRPFWWLGGVAIVPLIVHGLIRTGARQPEIIFSVVCVVLASAAAFVVTRLKSRLLRNGMPNKSLDASRDSVFRMKLS